jgi:hypothetical protein
MDLWPITQANSSATWPEQKASFLEDWLKSLCASFNNSEQQGPTEAINDEDGFSPNVTQKSMLSSALQSLLGIYTGRNQQAITQRFEQLARSIAWMMNGEQSLCGLHPPLTSSKILVVYPLRMDNPSGSGSLNSAKSHELQRSLPVGSCFGSWPLRVAIMHKHIEALFARCNIALANCVIL